MHPGVRHHLIALAIAAGIVAVFLVAVHIMRRNRPASQPVPSPSTIQFQDDTIVVPASASPK